MQVRTFFTHKTLSSTGHAYSSISPPISIPLTPDLRVPSLSRLISVYFPVMEQIQTYIIHARDSVTDPIQDFLLNNAIWNGFLGTFEAVMNSPVFQFIQDTLFKPFEPLVSASFSIYFKRAMHMVTNFWICQADILAYEINIPWFSPPYSTNVLGTPSCRRDSTNVQYSKRSGGYCKPSTSDGDLCRGSSKSHARSGTCSGASSDGYLPSSCNLSCAKDRCAKDPLCTVRRRDLPIKMDSLSAHIRTASIVTGIHLEARQRTGIHVGDVRQRKG